MQKVYNSIIETIGNTPIVRLNRVTKPSQHEFLVKLEYFNPGQSVKDRIAIAMIEAAEARGELKAGGTIVEATSGNTGLGLAFVAAAKGYKCIFVMPNKISQEKRDILKAFGAKVVITPSEVEPTDPRSYLSVSKQIAKETKDSFYVNQFYNKDNPLCHYTTTGPEIWSQTEGQIDAFVGGAGTGGTMSGAGRFLREKKKDIHIVCADPVGSILYDLFYHKKIVDPAKAYKVEGVGEDMLPDNVHLDVMTHFEKVTDEESFDMTRRLIAEEGLCVGPSSAMALVGAMKFSKTLTKPSKILVLMPDHGRAYLSKAFNENWLKENNLAKNLKVSDFAEIIDDDKFYKRMGYSLKG